LRECRVHLREYRALLRYRSSFLSKTEQKYLESQESGSMCRKSRIFTQMKPTFLQKSPTLETLLLCLRISRVRLFGMNVDFICRNIRLFCRNVGFICGNIGLLCGALLRGSFVKLLQFAVVDSTTGRGGMAQWCRALLREYKPLLRKCGALLTNCSILLLLTARQGEEK